MNKRAKSVEAWGLYCRELKEYRGDSGWTKEEAELEACYDEIIVRVRITEIPTAPKRRAR